MSVPTLSCIPRFCLAPVARGVQRYAAARKATHMAVTAVIALAEIVAICLIHELAVHVTLTTSAVAWEMLVITYSES
ncbi:hypothetical protein OHA25_08260 [Nonomuraea sp. NBC_00507]|uniref:hypothetical protein n=1 Tax=Nonomuraea sp. NBC_00507 TaxID=2976002 RepID=UPI002E16F33B